MMKYFIEYYKSKMFWFLLKIKLSVYKNDEKYVKKAFKKYHGYELDVENPKYLDEKITVNMYRDDSPFLKELTDKSLVRNYINLKGLGRILIQPFETFNATKDINFHKYSSPVVVKTNNCSGSFIKFYPNDKIPIFKLKMLDYLAKQNYYLVHREKNYDGIKGKIIVERMLDFREENIDYKFFCFDGKVEFVFLEHGIYNKKGEKNAYKRSIVDKDFKEIENFRENTSRYMEHSLKCPSNWVDMCECARKLSEGFNFVRVDLYSIKGKTYFGEMTFFHGAGFNKWSPKELDLYYANKIKVLPKGGK